MSIHWVRGVAPLAALVVLFGMVGGSGQEVAENARVSRANFAQDGSVLLPAGYRQWVHVGTRIKVGGKNILDGKDLMTPQVLNAYVEPSAMAFYNKTAKWPDGAQIVKEISSTKTGRGCDATSHFCTTELGFGIFEDVYSGLGMMVKDRTRYPGLPGNWGYFAFFRVTASYDASAKPRTQEQCATCHIRLAADTDYVIVKAHLGLSTGGAK